MPKHVFKIQPYPNVKLTELWINATNYVFESEKDAKNYCEKLMEIDYFWGYTITPLTVMTHEDLQTELKSMQEYKTMKA